MPRLRCHPAQRHHRSHPTKRSRSGCASPPAAQRVQESVWHHSQRLAELPGGGCLLTMRVGGIREIKNWVMSWGADVEVLAPAELRAQVAEDSRRMAARYADVA